MKLNKLTSTIAALALAATTFMGAGVTAQASNLSNGEYTADVTMWQYYAPTSQSMCDSLFAQKAEVTVSGEYAEITLYVASPIPNFADDSATAVANGGIMKDTVAVIGEARYESDYTVASINKYFSKTGSLFGITEGNQYTTDMIKVVVPTSAVMNGSGVGDGNIEKMIHIESFVNVFMNRTENFYMELTDIQSVSSEGTEDDNNLELPSQSETLSATVTATVAKNESTYLVTVPTSIELSELSTSDDTSVPYDVTVEFSKIGNDALSVEVTTEATGSIRESVSGYELAFANDFGTQTFTETKTVVGNVNVKGADVFNAEAGDYAGTVSFVITTNK